MFSFSSTKDTFISITIIGAIIIFGFTLAGGLSSFQPQIPPAETKHYLLVDGPDESKDPSLQLKTLTFIPTGCNPGYLSSGEPYILYATSPSPDGVAGPGQQIKLWYSDELALTLGDGAVSAMKNHPSDHVVNPQIGNQAKRDTQGFPIFPAIFLSDVTSDPNNVIGSAQQGGTPYPPSEVYGTWKAANAKNPQKNGWKLPAGADPFPAKSSLAPLPNHKIENEFSAEIIWNVNSLPLVSGHTYVVQFVLHDGDQNKNGGDLGIGCTTIRD
jgi:hypothetical protein